MFIDYALIFVTYLIGASYRTLKGFAKLRKTFPDFTPKKIRDTYFREEWNTMFATTLGLVVVEVAFFILNYRHVVLSGVYGSWWFIYVASCLFGWGGDNLAYKWLGSTEETLNREIGTKKTVEVTETPKSTTVITTTQEVTDKEKNKDK